MSQPDALYDIHLDDKFEDLALTDVSDSATRRNRTG